MIIISQVSAGESAHAAGGGHGHRGANSITVLHPLRVEQWPPLRRKGGPEWPVMVIVAHAAQRQAGADPQRFETAMPRSMPAPRAIRAVLVMPSHEMYGA